ncbi:MAG: SPOR domain-containing protein [Betaproteobacteria bacterium HGW-Betaproteobacteria-13]|jgi:hypothetical protein|uniref:SPOR domain-containing protein n=1 Tax=Parazoarcus communis TaxID=41977 RepID=A0A2U8H1W5_9RHOO|nr:SPOR domain-containing protein [Parazoarcus communis]AWI78675.1 hypothetical protein CEW87_04430 [Parazoarcus communis]PKO56555.1 MAG: SPOR domain-containing protein [Betaproteobacteria bacterium HGW-Betaproteobacteria-19]PKO81038.1 MAG: SPOR domain-containing protein [Betaproteobacteria bacterium HGW-Betaproteobacteria-13]
MTTLRFLFILLVILNALAFGALKGWFGFAAPAGEPERITNQLHPDRIKLLAPTSTRDNNAAIEPHPAPEPTTLPDEVAPQQEPVPTAAAVLICQAWSGLNASDADRLSARLTASGMTPRQRSTEVPTSWWVRIPPQPNRDAAERQVRALRAKGIDDLFIVQEAGPNQYAISLGLFKTEASSNVHLSQLRAKGVRGAGIATRSTVEYRIEVDGDEAQLASIADDEALARHRTGCLP